jgi:hypothetical protein
MASWTVVDHAGPADLPVKREYDQNADMRDRPEFPNGGSSRGSSSTNDDGRP